MSIYGKHEDPYFEPFGIIAVDGVSMLEENQVSVCDKFNINYEVFDITCPQQVEALKVYYNVMTLDGDVEGIVIKPDTWKVGDIPMIKVRNEEYLRLVYGYNYTKFLERHAREKDIRGKLNLSIREQELNLYLLNAFKQNDLVEQEEIYKLLLVEFSREEGIDPRL